MPYNELGVYESRWGSDFTAKHNAQQQPGPNTAGAASTGAAVFAFASTKNYLALQTEEQRLAKTFPVRRMLRLYLGLWGFFVVAYSLFIVYPLLALLPVLLVAWCGGGLIWWRNEQQRRA